MRKPEFLAINPNGKVPTLLIDGPVAHRGGRHPVLPGAQPSARNLMPADDPEAEAQVVSWMSFIASAIHPARQAGLSGCARSGRSPTSGWRNEWAVGGRYSIADIHLFRLYWRVREALAPRPGDLANIEAHYARMMARPAVRKTIEIEEKIGYSLPR